MRQALSEYRHMNTIKTAGLAVKLARSLRFRGPESLL